MNLEEYAKLKQTVDRLQRTADKAAGARDQLKSQLESGYGCASIEEGRTLKAKLEKEQAKDEQAADAAFKGFKEKWAELLNGEAKEEQPRTLRAGR